MRSRGRGVSGRAGSGDWHTGMQRQCPQSGDCSGDERRTVQRAGRRELVEDRLLKRVGFAVSGDAVAVGHHDERALFVDEPQFLGQEAGVQSRLLVEHGHGAEVVAALDDGDADRVPTPPRAGHERIELRLVRGGDTGVRGHERLLAQQVVACRVAMRSRRGRRDSGAY